MPAIRAEGASSKLSAGIARRLSRNAAQRVETLSAEKPLKGL